MTTCLVCPPQKARRPRRGLVCDGDRAWLDNVLSELPGLVEDLLVRDYEEDAAPLRGQTSAGHVSYDPVQMLLPASTISPNPRAIRVTGSKERPAPLSLDVVDLTSAVPVREVPDEFGDQTGEYAVVSVLAMWVQAWIVHRNRAEQPPTQTVGELCRWLRNRLDEACDTFEPVGDFAVYLKHARNAIRHQLGLAAPEIEWKHGVRCVKCDSRELYVREGTGRVECGNCPVLMTFDEYDTWVKALTVGLLHLRNVYCKKCRREQTYRLKGTSMSRCGWCEWNLIIEDAK